MMQKQELNSNSFRVLQESIHVKKLLVVIPLLFLIQPAFGEIIVQNDQTYVGNDGMLHIVGEIQNNSKAPLNKIKILAVLSDENGNEIDRFDGKMMSNVLMPGMKGGFDIITNQNNLNDKFSYELDFEYNLAAPKSQVIDIVSSELTRDQLNNVVITGTLDRDGKVLTISKTQVQPDFLRAGEESHFVIPIYEKEQSTSAVDYTIIAESDEFAAVPEFPLGTGALLIISVSSYVLFTRSPEKVTNALTRCSKILSKQ